MKTLAAGIAVLFALTIASADSTHGIKPRHTAADYPVFQQHEKLSLGAQQLSQKQVQHAFATELDKRYIVVEIGVFPAANGNVKLNAADFMLHVSGTKEILRPASPETRHFARCHSNAGRQHRLRQRRTRYIWQPLSRRDDYVDGRDGWNRR